MTFYEGIKHGKACCNGSNEQAIPAVRHLFRRSGYTIIPSPLCERDLHAADEVKEWLFEAHASSRCNIVDLLPGDWSERFVDRLSDPLTTNLPAGSLTMVSFVPRMYSTSSFPGSRRVDSLYRIDLGLTLYALSTVTGPVIMMSLVYTREVDWADDLAALPNRRVPRLWDVLYPSR